MSEQTVSYPQNYELARKVLPELSEEELRRKGMHGAEIRNFRVHDLTLKPEETTKCTGELWHCLFHTPKCDPKKGTVKLLSDGVEVDETTANPHFELIFRAPRTPGTYFVRAKHPGVPVFQDSAESDRVPVRVIKEEEKKPPKPPWWKRHKEEIAVAGVGLVGSAIAMEAMD